MSERSPEDAPVEPPGTPSDELPDFDVRGMSPDCPSALALERHRLGLPDPHDDGAVAAHVRDCLDCQRWLARARAGSAPGFDAAAALAEVQRRAAPAEVIRGPWRRPVVGAGVVLALAAGILVFAARPDDPARRAAVAPDDPDGVGTRIKGGLALYAWRARADGETDRLISGARVAPGDRIRFVVDLPEAGQVRVIGVEEDGAPYVAWPLDASLSLKRPAGDGQALGGAGYIDEAAGVERFHLVWCPADGPAPTCTAGDDPAAAPRCPETCRTTPFVVHKSGR